MTRSKVIILNLKGLYNVLLELKDFFKFELFYQEKEADLSEQNKGKNYLVISNKKISSNIDNKNIIILGELPIKILDLIYSYVKLIKSRILKKFLKMLMFIT